MRLNTCKLILYNHTLQENAAVVYQVPCRDSSCVYTGVAERRYGVRGREHQVDVKTLDETKYTRFRKKDVLMDMHPLAITDHVAKEHHTIDWEGVKFHNRDAD